MFPTVSIVGRPNVGKSTLFNRLIGRRSAIVDDTVGVTRDRHYGQSYWNDRDFSVIDTGGYLPDEKGVIIEGIREQVHIALKESDVILFVTDIEAGINPLDREIAQLLRKQETPVLVVANKADNEKRKLNATEFYELGFDRIFPVSSINGTGTGELLDRVVDVLPDTEDTEQTEYPKLAIVGRPNVGKSSLVNALLNSERCIVTDIPGTTRDAIHSLIQYKGNDYQLIDTAGLRKKAKIKENIEFYSTVRAHKSLQQCDIIILVLDAMRGFEEQDKRIVREAAQYNKGIVLVLNKWDIVPDKDTNVTKEFEEYIYSRIPMMEYIPIVTISALNKKRIYRVLDLAEDVLQERNKLISTPILNDTIQKILKERALPVVHGTRLKIKYATQVKSKPPVFKFFMNNPQDLPPNYRRYIEKKLRDYFSFKGVPLTLIFRQK